MSYARRYTDTLQAYLELKEQKAARRGEVEALVDALFSATDPTLWPPMGASREHVLNGRLATDPVYRDLQVQMDRTSAEATMYGIGSIIQNLAYLAKERRGS